MPDLVIIAGCNGAGKSTAAPELLQIHGCFMITRMQIIPN